uniref:3CxxC-type domain-containing protein n=1 Tax=Vannella robusta TaxID=1487602 RepID=A0A7S4IQ06_9EUKA|mmetsp:Transcript_6517/g.8045  ORF Transcript_6517/g.8045 Transcript_6517/m.8045 type:complete len:106 (+) Transcript_6517:1-318(+)
MHDSYFIAMEKLKAPFEGANGYWTKRIDFPGRKSFGYFQCDCTSRWTSAHAYKLYKQDCKKCEHSTLPKFMWVSKDIRNTTKVEKTAKPHHYSRCEACKLGTCDA